MEKKESPSVKGRGNEKWQLCDEKKKKGYLKGDTGSGEILGESTPDSKTEASHVKNSPFGLKEKCFCASQTRYRDGSEVVVELCCLSSGATGASAASPQQHPGSHLEIQTHGQYGGSTHLTDYSLTSSNTHQSVTMTHREYVPTRQSTMLCCCEYVKQ